MSGWVAPPTLKLELWYGDLLVAALHDVLPHQGTWFGLYRLKIARGDGERQDRLLDYIAFCQEFNRRIAAGEDHDFEEFDAFGDIATSRLCNVPRPDGGFLPMDGSVGFIEDQVSWNHRDSASREADANRVWERIAAFVASRNDG